MYNPLTRSRSKQRIYRGVYGTAAYQSVYRAGGHALDLVHQLGVPIAAALLLLAPLALLWHWAALLPAIAVGGLAVLGAIDMTHADPPRRERRGRWRFRFHVALHHLLQPLVRYWARVRHRQYARRVRARRPALPAPVARAAGGVVVVVEDRPRSEFAAAFIEALRARGLRVNAPSGWEDCDARLLLSQMVAGELQTSSHPEGYVQVRIRPSLRWQPVAASAGAVAISPLLGPAMALVLALPLFSLAQGVVRARRLPGQILRPPYGA
jgi:hypothetical protein